jgi:hypothetical protein
MSLKVTVHAAPDQFMISVPQAGWSERMPNIIALDKDDKICAIGAEAQEMNLAENFEQCQRHNHLRFINPFDLDKYGLQYAVALVNFSVDKALKKMQRDLTLGRLVHHFDFDIWLWNYESLSVETKYDFEHVLRTKPLLKVGNVSINRSPNAKPPAAFLQQRRLEARYRTVADYTLRLVGIFWIGLLFVGLYWLIPWDTLSNPVTFDKSGLGQVIVFIVVLAAIIYSGVFWGAVSWMYVMRRYLPVSVIREFLPKLGISKALIAWAADRILDK